VGWEERERGRERSERIKWKDGVGKREIGRERERDRESQFLARLMRVCYNARTSTLSLSFYTHTHTHTLTHTVTG
jgi:hypothetical protein